MDDETVLLELYPLAFEDESDCWEISTASGAQEALTFLERGPVDILVSDMRMPGMDGAHLLQEVMKRHPRTSRLIISGYSDSQQVAECLGATHQFLAKPCDLAFLHDTIKRVCALDEWMLDDSLRALVARLHRLPSLPSLYFRIMDAVASPDCSLQEIGHIIACDPAMTAKVLQLVNSAFFGMARRVSSPTEAVQHLGVERIRSLVLTLHVFSCFEKARIKGFSVEHTMIHCMATGLVAKVIASMQKAGREMAEEASVAGMLHDIGKIMLAVSLPDEYARAVQLSQEENIHISQAEREVFGATHAQVGAYLLGLWGLPVTIVEAVAFHHEPQQGPIKALSPLAIVHTANALIAQIEGHQGASALTTLDTAYLTTLGLADRVEMWRGAAEATLAGVSQQ